MFAHRVDAWMFCLKSVSVSVSLAWEQGHDQAQANTGPQALPDQQRSGPCPSCVISWFPNSTSLICLFEPWRRQGGASLASPGQSRRIRVGLPTPNKSQKMSHSPALVLASHLRGISHCHNSISNRYTDAASFFFTGPATGGIGTVPAYWERPYSTCRGKR